MLLSATLIVLVYLVNRVDSLEGQMTRMQVDVGVIKNIVGLNGK